MSSFPSMYSTEAPPPPPESVDSEDEDSEEFRHGGLKLDISADPSPAGSPRKGPASTTAHCTSYTVENGHQEETESLEDVNENDDDNDDKVVDVEYFTPASSASSSIEVMENGVDMGGSDELNQSENDENHKMDDEEGDGFADFRSIVTSEPSVSEDKGIVGKGENNEVAPLEFKGNAGYNFEDDDEFDDFQDFKTAAPLSSIKLENCESHDDVVQGQSDDNCFADFADFKSASQSSKPTTTTTPAASTSISSITSSPEFTAVLESKFNNILKTLFPPLENEEGELNSEKPPLLEAELKDAEDCLWKHTLDFEESRALLHKWNSSAFQQKLYHSLNIDTRTIVYTEKWGAIEVPRFAASMVETTILQPEISSFPSKTKSKPEDGVNDSGNSLPSTPLPNHLTKEAQKIIQRIPDISYMTSKTLVFPQAASSSSPSLL